MEDNKNYVKEITNIDDDFAQWYTDIVIKAELADYTDTKGCIAIRPYGYAIWENIQNYADKKIINEQKSKKKKITDRTEKAYTISKKDDIVVNLPSVRIGGSVNLVFAYTGACRLFIWAVAEVQFQFKRLRIELCCS